MGDEVVVIVVSDDLTPALRYAAVARLLKQAGAGE
jgi:hypothetical protein